LSSNKQEDQVRLKAEEKFNLAVVTLIILGAVGLWYSSQRAYETQWSSWPKYYLQWEPSGRQAQVIPAYQREGCIVIGDIRTSLGDGLLTVSTYEKGRVFKCETKDSPCFEVALCERVK
jgi:hypothetical protein